MAQSIRSVQRDKQTTDELKMSAFSFIEPFRQCINI